MTTIARPGTATAADENGVDRDLVARTLAGDREAYRVLVEKYQVRVAAIAFEVVRSRADAEDITQEAFVKAYLSLGEFRGQSAFYSWLYRIAYNMAIDFKRRVARRGGDAVEYEEGRQVAAPSDLSGRVVGPHEAVVEKEQRARLERVLRELSAEHRAVIVLREVEGLSYEDIADVTGVSKGTVMSRLHYARKAMQRALADIAPEGVGGGRSRGDGEGGSGA